MGRICKARVWISYLAQSIW